MLSLVKSQQEQVTHIQTRLPDLKVSLAEAGKAEAECSSANVEENDYTVFTCQDLAFELELVSQSIAKKIAFIENQVGTPANRNSEVEFIPESSDCLAQYDEFDACPVGTV